MGSLRQQIADILEVPNVDSWQVVDSEPPDLYLIHYTPDASMIRYGNLRGVVVDVTHRLVVARSFGYTPIALTDQLEVDSVDQKIHLTDAYNPNVNYELDPTQVKFKPGFDGVLVRVFLHNGRVYFSTHRRLNLNHLRWGQSPTFEEIYQRLGGPPANKLFDLSKKYSPYLHLFVLADPSLQVASKTPVGAGYLVYLGTRKIWSPDQVSWPLNQIDDRVHMKSLRADFVENPTKPISYFPPDFDIEASNHFLKFGFYNSFSVEDDFDSRLYPGEFLLAYLYDSDDTITGLLRIESSSYRWRAIMRDKNPHLEAQFFFLSNGKFIRADYPDERELYLRRFPVLTPYQPEDLESILPVIVWPELKLTSEQIDQILGSPSSRLYNIYLAFLYALPSHLQSEIITFYQQYQDHLDQISQQLWDVYQKGDLAHELIPARAVQIINLATSLARVDLDQGRIKELKPGIRKYLNHLVNSEEGASLYRIYFNTVKCLPN